MTAKKQRPPTKLEQLIHSTERNHRHLSTPDIMSRAGALSAQIIDIEEDIVELKARLAKLNARLVTDRAEMTGIENILIEREKKG